MKKQKAHLTLVHQYPLTLRLTVNPNTPKGLPLRTVRFQISSSSDVCFLTTPARRNHEMIHVTQVKVASASLSPHLLGPFSEIWNWINPKQPFWKHDEKCSYNFVKDKVSSFGGKTAGDLLSAGTNHMVVFFFFFFFFSAFNEDFHWQSSEPQIPLSKVWALIILCWHGFRLFNSPVVSTTKRLKTFVFLQEFSLLAN